MSEAQREQPVLRLEGLELGYGPHTVLRGVELQVHRGEFWFLLGPNGTGKTTLLRAILGTLAPRGGRIARHAELAGRERLGFVPQRCDLNPSLPTTVREFVLLGLVGTHVARPRHAEHLRWALERAGLAGLERADYWSLSGGQRQRALVARALVRRPSLMILDEPTEGLDLRSEDAFLRTLAELHRSGEVTLLFVTHRLRIAARFATHVALFHEGTVVGGPRRDVLHRSEIERIFGVSPELEPRPADAASAPAAESRG